MSEYIINKLTKRYLNGIMASVKEKNMTYLHFSKINEGKMIGMRNRFISAALALLLVFCAVFCASADKDDNLRIIRRKVSDNGYSLKWEEEPLYNAAKGGSSKRGLSNLPGSYDARDYDYVTSVKNQGSSGCCWAFSTISALESDAIVKGWETKDSVDFSEAHLAWATYTASTDTSDVNVGETTNFFADNLYVYGGNFDYSAATLAKGCGLTDEADYPFSPYNISAMGHYTQDDYYVNNGYTIGNVVKLTSDDEIKNWIYNHGSAVAMFYASGDFSYNTVNGVDYFTCYCPTAEESDHAITIIGWDDSFPKEAFDIQPSDNGAWLVKNSWGTNWGDNGYFWLSYEDATICDKHGFETAKADYDYIHTYNGATCAVSLKYPSALYYANVFNISTSQKLEDVSFLTYSPGENITVSVAALNNANSTPSSGTVVYTASMTATEPGFHKHSPDTTVILSPGYYAAIIKDEADEATCYLEYVGAGNFSYTASAGQSYYSVDGQNWTDASQYGNVFVNLYTSCNHSFNAVQQEATCTEPGGTVQICSICGKQGDVTVIPALGHSYTTESVEATCTSFGYSKEYCTRCGHVKSDTGLYILPHTPQVIEVPATCTQPGFSRTYCTGCNGTLSETVYPATGHSYDSVERNEDDDEITYTYHCSTCGQSFVQTTGKQSRNVISIGDIIRIILARLFPFIRIR